MFTGLVEETGTIAAVRKSGQSAQLAIKADKILSDLALGDSVCTNGVCLTVTSVTNKVFTVDVMHETMKCSNLGELKIGTTVNLERAMPANGRFGGHVVSGHIDGIGKISRIVKDGIAYRYTIKASADILKYIIAKGSVTIDGISLTVASIERESFTVSIIPHTAKVTSLSDRKIGATVNLENDIFGKYVEKFVNQKSNVTKEFLNKYGF